METQYQKWAPPPGSDPVVISSISSPPPLSPLSLHHQKVMLSAPPPPQPDARTLSGDPLFSLADLEFRIQQERDPFTDLRRLFQT